MIGGENEFENLERSLNNLRTACAGTSRALPVGRAQLASRRLIAFLASHVKQAGLPLSGTARDTLLSLVNLIFEDLMIGGDAESAVTEWYKTQARHIGHDPVGRLIDLVVP